MDGSPLQICLEDLLGLRVQQGRRDLLVQGLRGGRDHRGPPVFEDSKDLRGNPLTQGSLVLPVRLDLLVRLDLPVLRDLLV